MWPQWQGQHHSTAAGEQHVQQPSQPEAFPVRPCSVPLLSEDTWAHLPAWDECWVLSCSSIPPVCGFQGGLELWGSPVGLQPTAELPCMVSFGSHCPIIGAKSHRFCCRVNPSSSPLKKASSKNPHNLKKITNPTNP